MSPEDPRLSARWSQCESGLKAQVSVGGSGASEARLRAGPGRRMRAWEAIAGMEGGAKVWTRDEA